MGREGIDVEAQRDARTEWVRLHPAWASMEIERRSCLDMLMSRFGIDAALVSVPQLARALGMSKSTIYSRLEASDFFIPHRLVGRSPVFTVDDLVTWYLSGGSQAKRNQPEMIKGAGPVTRAPNAEVGSTDQSSTAFERRRLDAAVDAMVAKAVARVAASKR